MSAVRVAKKSSFDANRILPVQKVLLEITPLRLAGRPNAFRQNEAVAPEGAFLFQRDFLSLGAAVKPNFLK